MISLLIACVYLGLATGLGTGLGTGGTGAEITGGFGEIMAEVGLLIGFGVLIGALLHSMGTFGDLVEILARRVGRRLPYAMAGTLSTIFPSIYVDVPLGVYLLYGLPIGLTTALVTTFLFRLLLGRGFWNDETDYDPDVVVEEGRVHDETEDVPRAERASHLPLVVRLLPILVPLVLIATGSILDVADASNDVFAFLGDANIALFLGLLIAFGMVRSSLGADGVGPVLGAGFHTTGDPARHRRRRFPRRRHRGQRHGRDPQGPLLRRRERAGDHQHPARVVGTAIR